MIMGYAIKITEENKLNNIFKGLEVGEWKVISTLPKRFNRVLFYKPIDVGFIKIEYPVVTKFQEVGELVEGEGGVPHYPVRDFTPEEVLQYILKTESDKYSQRILDGQEFSNRQGAKLILLDAPDDVKKHISEFFAPSQNFLVLGWWKSALRDLASREESPHVSADLLTQIIGYIKAYILKSY